jgi:plastocyanin
MGAFIKSLLIGLSVVALTASSDVSGQTAYTVSITANGYEPAQLTVAANQAFQVTISNNSAHSVELEGRPLNSLVGLNPGAKSTVLIDPLAVGTYTIIDDLHPSVGPLTLIAQ